MGRLRVIMAAAVFFVLLGVPAPQVHALTKALNAPCGVPITAGVLVTPPQIEVSTLPVDDRGLHELILRVARDRERFCFEYALNGEPQNVAPILRMHRGERFALRIVNQLHGPAPGATLPASALTPCKPSVMPAMMPTIYRGYLNHTIYARRMKMPDIDVNLHLHGFEGPAAEENVFLSTLSTPMHACEYDITIPRTQPPGTYYYHPHAHGMSDDEVAGGLSGMWIVEPDTPQVAGSDEHPLILQYRVPFVNDNNFIPDTNALDFASAIHEGALSAAPPVSYNPFHPPAWPSSFPIRFKTEALADNCGNRSGARLVVNGMEAPARLTLPPGRPQLLRLLNATSDSVEFLHLKDAAGHARPLQVVGRDGIPVGGDGEHPLSRFASMPEAEVVPTGRLDLLLTLSAGDVLTLYGDHHCIAPVDEFRINHDVLTIAAGQPAQPGTVVASRQIQNDESPALRLLRYARAHPKNVHRRAITYTEYIFPANNHQPVHAEFYITETSVRNFHEHPFWPIYRNGAVVPEPDVVVKRGTIEEWYIFNTTMEEHTFHIHQMAFVAEDAKPGPAMVDTTLVPFGKMLPNRADPDYPLIKPSLTRVLLDFRNVPRGTFVFHCHMLFHEDRGMMAVIRVV